MTVTSQFLTWRHCHFFSRCCVYLVKFNCWSKFHVNIITGSKVMTIFIYKGLTRNLKIGNTPIWVLPNFWILHQVRNTKFGMDISNEMLLNAVKCQGSGFYRFWIIKGNPTGGNNPPPSTQISIKVISRQLLWHCQLIYIVCIPIFNDLMILFCDHNLSYFLTLADLLIVWHILPLITFSTINSISMSVNSSRSTSFFSKTTCHVNPVM